MDLFGDLPAAKSKRTNTTDDLFGGLPPSTTTDKPNTSSQHGSGGESSSTAGNTDRAKSQSTQPSKSLSLVSALGNAGTTMAFVPMALSRNKKKKGATTSASAQSTGPPSKKSKGDEIGGGEAVVVEASSSYPPVVLVGTAGEATEELTPNLEIVQPASDPTAPATCTATPYLEDEPEPLRLLHASVVPSSAYDPHRPNDYLAHRERKKSEHLRKQMERSALERLERQEKLRKKIAEERKKVEREGDWDGLVEMALSRGGGGATERARADNGMGRGRGLSNLPAWLVKKQQEEREAKLQQQSDVVLDADTSTSQFDDVPVSAPSDAIHMCDDVQTRAQGRVVLLTNMVPPGEVDAYLSSEVREECTQKCGPVSGVAIRQRGEESGGRVVEVYVAFDQGKDAIEAARVFDGRMFGARRISARLVRE